LQGSETRLKACFREGSSAALLEALVHER